MTCGHELDILHQNLTENSFSKRLVTARTGVILKVNKLFLNSIINRSNICMKTVSDHFEIHSRHSVQTKTSNVLLYQYFQLE